MIDIDITMPIQIANILILIVLMNIVLYRPVRGILAEREKKVTGMKNDIENFNKDAKLRLEEFDAKIREARNKAKAEFEGVRSAAQQAESESLAQLRKEADAKKSEQLNQIAKEFAGAQSTLKGQVEGFANEMATKVLGRAV